MDSHLGLILILAWMYSTSELDELFQIPNSIKGFKLNNHKGATQHYQDGSKPAKWDAQFQAYDIGGKAVLEALKKLMAFTILKENGP